MAWIVNGSDSVCLEWLSRPSRKQILSLGRFPEVGKKQKTERKERERKDWTMLITMASYALQTPPQVAHAKPPVPKKREKDRTMVITMAQAKQPGPKIAAAWTNPGRWSISFSFSVHICFYYYFKNAAFIWPNRKQKYFRKNVWHHKTVLSDTLERIRRNLLN